ncbi:hypothetical protein EMPS_11443 [Entomortierella parvispora]|uniref:Uncharacterized protein n=1 Tax=Entomortierella parvispora TaxID=205924 RepID=A0A9P3HLR2_9FUNG|nr:hypothetical protein EMPS_11443 [Entomortierella parvispora]
MTDKRKLFCVYDGSPPSRSFEINKIEADVSSSRLAQEILQMSNKPFDPSNVPTLSSVDLSLADMDTNININSYIGDKEMLDPRKSLSTLSRNGVTYIIIQLSSPGASLVGTPSPANVSVALARIVDDFFASDSDQVTFLKEFVQGSKDLPVTRGGVPGLPCVRRRGFGRVRTAPSMLFLIFLLQMTLTIRKRWDEPRSFSPNTRSSIYHSLVFLAVAKRERL